MKNFMEICNTGALVLMFIVVIISAIISWIKYGRDVIKQILAVLWILAVYYLNAPMMAFMPEGAEVSMDFFAPAYFLYKKYSLWYTILSNILLAISGVLIQNMSINSNNLSSRKVKKKMDSYISNATQLKIIGRDLSFLGDSDYASQKTIIYKLKDKAQLLCEWTNDTDLLKLYYDLHKNGNPIRAYSSREGITNLKGQIKTDEDQNRSGIFITKNNNKNRLTTYLNNLLHRINCNEKYRKRAINSTNMFKCMEVESGYVLDSITEQFDRTFANALHPFVRCIALDLGGVYFQGDIDTFYKYLEEEYGIQMKKGRKDRLNIDTDLMLGKINICDFIKYGKRNRQKEIVSKLTEEDWADIMEHWQKTWEPDPQIKELIENLSALGYYIVPFSNLDGDNGDKYLRNHDLPNCCEYHYFSYEQETVKPESRAFDNFAQYVKEKLNIEEQYQILLVDDEDENIQMAHAHGWETIKYYRDDLNGKSAEILVRKLKEKAILPECYQLPKIMENNGVRKSE